MRLEITDLEQWSSSLAAHSTKPAFKDTMLCPPQVLCLKSHPGDFNVVKTDALVHSPQRKATKGLSEPTLSPFLRY